MKQLIIILGTVMLGIFIFNMILSDDSESLKENSKTVMQKQIEQYKITP